MVQWLCLWQVQPTKVKSEWTILEKKSSCCLLSEVICEAMADIKWKMSCKKVLHWCLRVGCEGAPWDTKQCRHQCTTRMCPRDSSWPTDGYFLAKLLSTCLLFLIYSKLFTKHENPDPNFWPNLGLMQLNASDTPLVQSSYFLMIRTQPLINDIWAAHATSLHCDIIWYHNQQI